MRSAITYQPDKNIAKMRSKQQPLCTKQSMYGNAHVQMAECLSHFHRDSIVSYQYGGKLDISSLYLLSWL